MKYLNILTIFLLCSVVMFNSCGSEDSVRKDARENLVVPETPSVAPASSTAANPPTAEPAQNTEGVWHYTCAKGCEGGAGSAQPCAVCGAQLAHNQGYHSSTPTNTNANKGNSPINSIGTPSTNATPTVNPKAAEPAQNAAGVWHYTCSNGCSGGGGSASACGGCGGTLAHNKAYHE